MFTPLFPQQDGNAQGSNPPGFTPLGSAPAPQAPAPAQSGFVEPGSPESQQAKPTVFGQQIDARADQTYKILHDQTPAGKTNVLDKGAALFGQGVGALSDLTTDVIGAGLHIANQATGGTAGLLADKAVQAAIKTPLGAMGVHAVQQGSEAWQNFVDAHPRAAQDLSAIGPIANLLTTFYTGGAAGAGIKATTEAAAPLIKTGVEVATTAAKTGVKDATEKVAAFNAARQLNRTVDAVNPELTGTKLTQAYKDVVSGGEKTGRDATAGGVIKQQALSTNSGEKALGKRLFDAGIKLANKPVKDLQTLRTALTDTENELTDVLKNSKAEFGADKIPLINKLGKLSKGMSEEDKAFEAIKDNPKLFSSVVNFGKKVIMKSQDSIQGLREARTAFDAQARLEFPSAFKDGTIDLKTPAGRAIKSVRDTINDHLYTTAPEGSDIQRLIGQESDIYRARDAIAPKAAATHGTSKFEQIVNKAKKHPLITAGVTYEAAKHTIAPQLPGF